MAKKSDCICQVFAVKKDGELLGERVQYNPRCPFHKGPDKGFGYDDWGRPNDKHSERVGTIGAAVVVVACGILIVGIIVWLVTKW